MSALSLSELSPYVDGHYHHDYLRLETRAGYGNPKDQAELQAYLAGEPPATELTPFHRRVREHTSAGRTWRVLHAVSHPLSDYLRYELEWGYTRGLMLGEQIKITELTAEIEVLGDLLILDDQHVLRMLYRDDNTFMSAALITDPRTARRVTTAAARIWDQGTPFATWWTDNPQYHRDQRAA